jgi:ATP-binding cassette subfamily F protein 3
MEKIQHTEQQMALVENYSDAENITALVQKKEQLHTTMEQQEEAWLSLTMEIEELEDELA